MVDSGSASTLLALGNLTLVQGQYSCLLRGINAAGIESDVITKNFTILRDSPSLTGKSNSVLVKILYTFPKDKISALTKLEAFADDNLKSQIKKIRS